MLSYIKNILSVYLNSSQIAPSASSFAKQHTKGIHKSKNVTVNAARGQCSSVISRKNKASPVLGLKRNFSTNYYVTAMKLSKPSRIITSPFILLSGSFKTNVLNQQSLLFSTFTPLSKKMQGSEYISEADKKCETKKEEKSKSDCGMVVGCLKIVRPPGFQGKIDPSKYSCGRICMPCCPPARFPPICYFPNEKKHCIRAPNPRPAFSECAKDAVCPVNICDCCSVKPPPCKLLPDIKDECS